MRDNSKKKLYMTIKNHRLSRLIHGTPSIIGYGRRTRERRRRRRRHNKDNNKMGGGILLQQLFSGGGVNKYGKLDANAKGWDEERIERLLQRTIPEHELSLPNEPPPRLTVDYLSKRFGCLPIGLYRNILKQTLDRRPQRIESYFAHQYGSVPPRVRRLLTGSYYGSFFKPEVHKVKEENEPLDEREYRRRYPHRLLSSNNRLSSSPQPGPSSAPSGPPPPSHAAPPSNLSSLFNFSSFSPISTPSSSSNELDTLLETLLKEGELPHLPSSSSDTTPPPPSTPPFQILPLTSNDPPPVTAVEAVQQKKITSAEKSAQELETILSVAGSSIRSVINELQSPVETAAAEASSIPTIDQQQQHPDERWNDLKDMFKKLEEEVNSDPKYNNSGIATENLYDDLLDHNNSPLPPPSRRRPTAPPPPRITGYVPHKKMLEYVPHKKMSAAVPQSSHSDVGTSPMPPPPQSHSGTQMDHDLQTHNKIRSVYEDFCKGKTNTRHTTHRLMDIVHQVAKDNIR